MLSSDVTVFQEVMKFLTEIENAFQEAENFLASSNQILPAERREEFDAIIGYLQQTRNSWKRLREEIPEDLERREDEYLKTLRKVRAQRAMSSHVNS